MADTYWKQTTENENVTAILQSLVGIGYLELVPAGALLIEDAKWLRARLVADIMDAAVTARTAGLDAETVGSLIDMALKVRER